MTRVFLILVPILVASGAGTVRTDAAGYGMSSESVPESADSSRLVPHGFTSLIGSGEAGEPGFRLLGSVPAWLDGFIGDRVLPEGTRLRMRLSRRSFLLGCSIEIRI